MTRTFKNNDIYKTNDAWLIKFFEENFPNKDIVTSAVVVDLSLISSPSQKTYYYGVVPPVTKLLLNTKEVGTIQYKSPSYGNQKSLFNSVYYGEPIKYAHSNGLRLGYLENVEGVYIGFIDEEGTESPCPIMPLNGKYITDEGQLTQVGDNLNDGNGNDYLLEQLVNNNSVQLHPQHRYIPQPIYLDNLDGGTYVKLLKIHLL